jgi:hypothetical protein
VTILAAILSRRIRAASLILALAALGAALPAQGPYPNIRISGTLSNYEPEEPSIAMDPVDLRNMVVGCNLNHFFTSTDGGATWIHGEMASSYGEAGDPVLLATPWGSFYYFHLSNQGGSSWLDRIVCQRLDRIGDTWSDGTYMGYDAFKDQDKPWAAVDPASGAIYAAWTRFDAYGSADPANISIIRFSRSTDGGETWSEAVRLNEVPGDCLDGDATVEGAVPAVGPEGQVYVAWAGPAGIVFDRSIDGGGTWLATDVPVTDVPGGWTFNVPGIYRCNGLPVTDCDRSRGPHRGRVYINWSDQRNGAADTDVWLARSTDQGATWSPPVRVNDDPPGRHQFFTWMAVDDWSGFVWVVFYDRREHAGSQTDVYLALSRDGGETFTNFKVSDATFLPAGSVFFGDYTQLVARGGVVRPVWARLDQFQLSLWTALVDPVPGDADGDLALSSADAVLMANLLGENARQPMILPEFLDLDGDGRLTVADLIWLQARLAGLLPETPA